MALQTSGAISLADIQTEFGGSNPISINEYYRGGGLVPSSVTAVPASGTIDFADFYGTSNVSATTYYSSISAASYSVDSAVSANANLEVFYSSGNIDVRLNAGGDSISPADGTIVYRISNAPSGYTVKRGTLTVNADDSPFTTGTTIGTTATAIPTSTSFVDAEYEVDSGGGFDDPGYSHSNFSSSLIFEKSGATTFTYSFTIDLEAENAGEGGL